MAHDSLWATEFGAEAARIWVALGRAALRIDHVGSTAIPDLPAKPIIDIQVSVTPLHPLDEHLRLLRGLGYSHVPHPDDATYPFLHRPNGWPHTHHVHLCEIGSAEERRHLAFRDYLRDHPREAADYAAEKRRLVAVVSSTVEGHRAYAEAKAAFVERLVQRALALGYPRADV